MMFIFISELLKNDFEIITNLNTDWANGYKQTQ